MKLSIIISTFNRKDKLIRCINSIFGQSSKLNYEILIIDDNSNDGTQEMFEYINSPRIKYFRIKNNGGKIPAVNYGIKKASGTHITFIDDDDLFHKDFFKYIIKYKTKIKGIALFPSLNTQGYSSGIINKTKEYTLRDLILKKDLFGELNVLAKSKIIKKNPYDESVFYFESFSQYFWYLNNHVFGIKYPSSIKDTTGQDRVSNKLLDPKNSNQRFKDYNKYIKRFKQYYLKNNLLSQLNKIYFNTAFYGILSNNDISESLNYFKLNSVKYYYLFKFLDIVPHQLFLVLYRMFLPALTKKLVYSKR